MAGIGSTSAFYCLMKLINAENAVLMSCLKCLAIVSRDNTSIVLRNSVGPVFDNMIFFEEDVESHT